MSSNSPFQGSGSGFGNRLAIVFVTMLGLILAVIIGYQLPQVDYLSTLLILTAVVGLFYTFVLSRNVFFFAFFAVALDVTMQPLGFKMEMSVLIGALFAPVFLLTIWRKDIVPSPILIKYSQGFRALTFIVLGYIGVHFWYTWRDPVLPFSFGNVGKSYYNIIFPFVLILLFLLKPPSVNIPKNPIRFISWILFAGLVFNIILFTYGTYFLGFGSSEFEGDEVTHSVLYIPFLNLIENKYALRMLGPFTALFAVTILTSPLESSKEARMRLFLWVLLFLSFLGSLISMGRATVLFTMFLSSGMFIWRRRFAPLLFFFCIGIFAIITVRFSYEYNPTLIPMPIQRTVALIPGMEMEKAKGSIEGSSDWRYKIFQMALADWQSTPRSFWFGRSTSTVSGSDTAQAAIAALKENVVLDVSLKRAATHNLITDLLVNIGLIGALLVFLLWAFCVLLLFRLARLSFPDSAERQLFIVAGIFGLFTLIYGVIGGATFPMQTVVLTCMGVLFFKKSETSAQK